MPGTRVRAILLLSSTFHAACTSPDTSEPPVEIRDSAGIRIVEYLSTETPVASWRVSEEPVFRHGWGPDDSSFVNIGAGAILSDGRAVIAEADGSGIFFFSVDGSIENKVGRNGEGPGEFQNVSGIHRLPGDSVLVMDDGNVRASVLDPRGGYIRASRVVPRGGFLSYRTIGVSSTGHVLLWPVSLAPSGAPAGWVDGSLLRVSPDGLQVDTVFVAAWVENFRDGPWDPFPAYAMTEVGSGLITYARSDIPEVVWYDENGSKVQISRWAHQWVPVNDSVWQAYSEAYMGRFRAGTDLAPYERNLAERRGITRGVLPAFGTLHTDVEGTAWVGEYEFFARHPDRYLTIHSDGTLNGWVHVPDGLTILDIGIDRILGIERNEVDVQAVVVYRLEKH